MTVATLLTLALAASPPDWKTLQLPSSLRAVLDRGAFASTPSGFKPITLSHLADGCASQGQTFPERRAAARHCVAEAFRRALELTPAWCDQLHCDQGALLAGAEPLALAHLLLVLGAADTLGPCLDPTLHEQLAANLSARSTAEPTHHLPSYRALAFRWPADQSALLAGLARFDAAHGTTLHQAPLAGYLAFLDERGLHRSGLPVSEVTLASPGARFPRGCAQSFISRYLAEVDAPRAHAFWLLYRRQFLVELPLGVLGFREWPVGVDGPADTDSGPIVLGIGTAASALAISAARAQGDVALAQRLEVSADRVLSLGVAAAVAEAPFAQAIRFEGRWHRATVAQ